MSSDNGQEPEAEMEKLDPLAVLHGGFHHGMIVPDANSFYKLPVVLVIKGQKKGLMYKEVYKPRGCTDGAKVWAEPWLDNRPEALVIVEQLQHSVIDTIRCKFKAVRARIDSKNETPLGVLSRAVIMVGLKGKPAPVPVIAELVRAEILICPVLNMDGTADLKLHKELAYRLSDHVIDKSNKKEGGGEHDNRDKITSP